MIIKKICCMNADFVGGTFSSVVALKCPEIEVYVIDENKEKIQQWNSNKIPVHEPNLDQLVKKCRDKNLFFTSDPSPIKSADIIFICTNLSTELESKENARAAELKALEDATIRIVNTAECSKIIVEKSMIPVKAVEAIGNILKAHQEPYRSFTLISNPEFLSEGCSLNELLNPERVLIGGDKSLQTAGAIEALISVYEHWVPRSNIVTSDAWSTELSNLAHCAFLAQRITSMNSLSEVCEVMDADINEVAEVIGMDSRIGAKDLKTWIGFRGVNLLKSIRSIIYLCESLDLPEVAAYWQKVLDTSDYHKHRFARKIVEAFFNSLKDRSLAILGFSSKKDTACTYDTPAIDVCKVLLEEGAKLKICDPVVPEEAILKNLRHASRGSALEKKLDSLVQIFRDPYEATSGAHGVVLCTDWPQFVNIDYYKVFHSMTKPAFIFDGRKVLPHKELQEIGFHVQTFGKKLAPVQTLF